MKLDYFTLLSCTPDAPYRFSPEISVYPPTLGDIRALGYGVYQSYTNVLAMTKGVIAEMLKIDAGDIQGDSTLVMASLPLLREAMIAALAFFIRSELRYDESTGFELESGAYVSLDDLRELRKVILRFSYIEYEEEDAPLKFRSGKTRQRYERYLALKAEQAKANRGKSVNPDMELSNLIGAVSTFSPSYNLTNIWGLTVFQFYDQFIRLNSKMQIDVSGIRWAAYGKEDFDWGAWHKAVRKNAANP